MSNYRLIRRPEGRQGAAGQTKRIDRFGPRWADILRLGQRSSAFLVAAALNRSAALIDPCATLRGFLSSFKLSVWGEERQGGEGSGSICRGLDTSRRRALLAHMFGDVVRKAAWSERP
jgi:hypothetical protein